MPLVFAATRVPGWTALVLVPVALVGLYAVAVFAIGLRYRVTPEGVEIRSPLRRIAFVPATEIVDYEVVQIDALSEWGGWGVRGLGSSKAYILGGGEAVRIDTNARRLWLGLRNATELPESLERLMRSRDPDRR